jgi:hypothetical protein
MKTSPAIWAGVLCVVCAIALKVGAWLPGHRGSDPPRIVSARKSGASRTAAGSTGGASNLQAPEKAPTAYINAQKMSSDRDLFLAQHCGSMLAAIQTESNSEIRERMLTDLAAWMEGYGAAAGLTFLSTQLPSELIQDLQELLLERWAGKDPPAAANAVLKIAGWNAREALGTVLGVWADVRLSAAISWVNQMPDGAEKQAALLRLTLEAARTDPVTAVSLASKLPSSPERDEMIIHATSQWAGTDPTGASAWAHEIEEGPLRDQLLTTIATIQGESDPLAAATLAIEELPPGKPRDDALVGIVQRWAQNDPNAAATWVSAFPEGALRSAAVANVVKLWVDQDARPAGEWLNTLPPSASRDNGVRAYAEQIAPSSPRQAAVWAGTITDPQMRIAQLENIGTIWMVSDPIAATAWLSQMPFSQQARSLGRLAQGIPAPQRSHAKGLPRI